MSSDMMCFQCGQPAGDPLRMNHMPNGAACPTCRDRLLDSLPAPFPTAVAREHESQVGVFQPEEGAPEHAESQLGVQPKNRLRPVPPVDPSDAASLEDGDFKPSA